MGEVSWCAETDRQNQRYHINAILTRLPSAWVNMHYHKSSPTQISDPHHVIVTLVNYSIKKLVRLQWLSTVYSSPDGFAEKNRQQRKVQRQRVDASQAANTLDVDVQHAVITSDVRPPIGTTAGLEQYISTSRQTAQNTIRHWSRAERVRTCHWHCTSKQRDDVNSPMT